MRKHPFRFLCFPGLIISLLIWALPGRVKPYHIRRELDDYKILLVQQNSEWGFGDDGLVRVRTSLAFAGTRQELASVRQDWIAHVASSKQHWPASTRRPHYDEWGPSRWLRPDGVEVTQVGSVFCLPYSILAIAFALPLVFVRRKKKAAGLRISGELGILG